MVQASHTHKSIEAEAEAAVCQEILAVMEDQEREAAELKKLELENLERQQAMEEQRRKIERLEEVKKLNAARAKVKVYAEAESISESRSLVRSIKTESETSAIPAPPQVPSQAPNTTQAHNATSPAFVPRTPTVINQAQQNPGVQPKGTTGQAVNASSLPFIPKATQAAASATHPQPNLDLVSILADAISANRLPTLEPALFTGDPLKFKDWQLSFETLIERKNIPKNEKLYYLRKYLGGPAKRVVEGFLLVGTDEAYDAAWEVRERCFGDLFTIGKCFRDKLHSLLYCKRNGHTLDKCFKFTEKSVQDRIKFVQAERLCFGCLKGGHHCKKCDKRNTCEKCQKKHPTCVHDDKFVERRRIMPETNDNSQDKGEGDEPATAITNRVTQVTSSTLTSTILPVWVSSKKSPRQRSSSVCPPRFSERYILYLG